MTTPTGAADEREQLIKYCVSAGHADIADMLRADAEMIRGLTEMRDIFERQWNVTCEQLAADAETITEMQHASGVANQLITELRTQLAAQSAELEANAERIRAVIHRMRWYADDGERPDEWLLKDWANELERALAAPSAADGYKEPSEAQMFGGDLYSGIKP